MGGQRGRVEGWGGGRGGEAEFDNYFVLFILSLKMPFSAVVPK